MKIYLALRDEGNDEEAADALRELEENGAGIQKLKEDYECGRPDRCLSGCSHLFCVNVGVLGKCVLYTGYYICSSYQRCY